MVPHIKELHVENFKCFQNLRIDGLKQVNLIGGKNNVGKTALLESIELFMCSDNASDFVGKVRHMLIRRQHYGKKIKYVDIDFFYDNKDRITINSGIKNIQILSHKGTETVSDSGDFFSERKLAFMVFDGAEVMVRVEIPLHSIESTENFFTFKKESKIISVNFINSAVLSDEELAIFYGSFVDMDMEYFIDQSLSQFDEQIVSFKPRATEKGMVLKVKLKEKKEHVLLSSMGEGVSRYIAILCAIWASKDGVLLIDEIENGIHYTNYPKFWKLIHQASRDANCQIFATTHSKECIEAFNQTQLEAEQENYPESAYFELFRNAKTEMIDAHSRSSEQLRYALTHEGRMRGE